MRTQHSITAQTFYSAPERFTPDLLLTLFSNPPILRIASIINYCPCILPTIPMTMEYSGRSHLKSLFRLFGFHYLVHQSGALAVIPHGIIRCLLLCRRFPPAFSCLIPPPPPPPPPARLWVSVPAQFLSVCSPAARVGGAEDGGQHGQHLPPLSKKTQHVWLIRTRLISLSHPDLIIYLLFYLSSFLVLVFASTVL